MRLKVLAFSFFPALLPPTNGGVERLFRIYSELAKRFDITLITSGHVHETRSEHAHSPSFKEVRVPKDSYFETCYAGLQEVAGEGDLSGPALGLATKCFGSLHEEYLRHHNDAHLIIHDSPFLIGCDLFRGFDGKPRIYQSYNVESLLYAGFHSGADAHRRIEQLVRELEQDVCAHADLITACSDEDGAEFSALFQPSAPIIVAPNGFTPSYRFPDGKKRRKNMLLFLGSSHRPNTEAAAMIRDQLAPSLPDFEFHLVGGCAPKGRKGNVIAHGHVDHDTKLSLLQTATAALNPIISGSGSSLKIADFADNCVPLLSTPFGARGFKLEPGTHYVPLHLEKMVDIIRSATGDAARLAALSERSYRHFRDNFTWERIGAKFADHIQRICQRQTPTPPRLVINDYDSFTGVGGGATRTRGLCKGLSESAPIIFLCFAGEKDDLRRTELDGRALILKLPKTANHLAEHTHHNAAHPVSTADLVNYRHAPLNKPLLNTFSAAAAISSVIICEHPYMVGLPRAVGVDFIYSSQNFELALKRDVLAGHPQSAEMLGLAEEAERFACGASRFIIAVSEDDARALGGHYRFAAPIHHIANGSEAPAVALSTKYKEPKQDRPTAVFMGSPHLPNIEAARWINAALANQLPDIDFVILGGVGDCLTDPRPNVRTTGMVSLACKSHILYAADVAINPMMSGSGSNVKVADFLQHGLPVVSTRFGARGYEGCPASDLVIVGADAFAEGIRAALAARQLDDQQSRAARYEKSLSMDEGGRQLAELLQQYEGDRLRALYVTYRYNEPSRGGGEAHVVRLAHALARSGWSVDVVSPAAEQIENVERFAALYSGPAYQPIPIGRSRVRSGKFPLDQQQFDSSLTRTLWATQPAYEAELYRNLERPDSTCLAWGWGDMENGGRWALSQSAIFLSRAGRVALEALSIGKGWLQVFSEDGELLKSGIVDGRFSFALDAPQGFIELRYSLLDESLLPDSRPLAFFANSLSIEGPALRTSQIPGWSHHGAPASIFAAHEQARAAVRDGLNVGLSELRHGSQSLMRFVSRSIADYDLLITHNAVFGEATSAVRLAHEAGVPSVFIPHLHYDDDFYHFPDIVKACERATVTLVAPSALTNYFRSKGMNNIQDHGPGVDANIPFTSEDSAVFRRVLGRDDDFVLVLGRKAAAKGYREVIAAAERSQQSPLVVLIGPDDDGKEISSEGAIYLGPQPDQVVRGALRECLALVNMSRSESFGMVLIEAGLAGKPVLANRACAAFCDLVEHGENGFLVDMGDLQDHLDTIVANPQLRQALGEEGRIRALAHDWRKVEEDFITMCNNLVTKQ